MSERLGHAITLTEHELSEIRMLIHERTGISFDESRERFFSTRVREHMHEKGHKRGNGLIARGAQGDARISGVAGAPADARDHVLSLSPALRNV